MTGLTDRSAQGLLGHITGKAAIFTEPTAYVALFTAVGSDAGTGFTEVSGGSYARVATSTSTWNAASGSAPSQISNSAAITFPTAGSSWGTVIAWGLYDAPTGGNLLAWDYLGSFPWLPFTCTSGSPGALDAPAHGYSNGDSAVVSAEYGGTLPTTGGSWAGLLTVASVSGDTFNLGVSTSSTGNGMVRKVASLVVSIGITPSFAGGSPGALLLQSA